ncbi:MAG: class I SAM-dependent RNA methyltransferase [Bdellovibrionales bacterium]
MAKSKSTGEDEQKSSLVGSQVQVQIEKMTVGGAGLARHDGLVIFVDFAAPGDELLIEIIEHKKNLAYGRLLKVVKPGPSRVSPPCPHFGTCGGCSWQHLDQPEQLRQKELLLRDSLKGLRLSSKTEFFPIVPSPRSYQYRNRVQMTFQGERLAFRAKRSHDLVPIRECHLVESPLQEMIQNPPAKTLKPSTRYDLRIPQEGAKPQLTALSDETEIVGFSQVNRFQNEDLIAAVLKAFEGSAPADLYEFYAGSGNFTFPLVERFKFSHVWAVEASPALVKLAHQQIQEKNLSSKRISFHLADVSAFLKRQWPRREDAVFLDPPRIGADEFVMKTLAQARPHKIVYLSCHPVTLARDLQRLLNLAPEYQVERVQPFEMFPQTDHLETLVSLSLTQV